MNGVKLLLVEDEVLFAKSVIRRLQRDNLEVRQALNIAAAREELKSYQADILLLDVRLPDGNGLTLLAEIRADETNVRHSIPVIVMTAYGELDDAVSAMKLGATDYLKKPVDLDELSLTIKTVFSREKINQKLDYSQLREKQAVDSVSMIGQCDALTTVSQQLIQVAHLVERTTESSPVILIRGETGTGKDVAARLYHQSGNWNDKPFVHVDCASLPRELMEAELFGYERGAFTHAHQAKPGLIEVAEGGTLFLDEVAELPLELQVKLLNVLERRVVRRIGSTKEIVVSAHFVAATNRNLNKMVEEGTFRSDLYYRLNIVEIELPALRQRGNDISLLANYFIDKLARRYGLPHPQLTQEAISRLQSYSWPGNIRELQHVLERAVMLCHDGIIDVNSLPMNGGTEIPSEGSLDFDFEKMTLDEVEKVMIEAALNRTDGNVSRAARELGLTRMAMRYRMDKYKL